MNDLTTPISVLENEILNETDSTELNKVIDLFNVNLQKKNILRNAKLSDVQDKVVNQMYERLDKRADEFSNDDLIKYHKAIQETLSKSDTTLENVPQVQINQQVNLNTFDRESRQRIIDTVNAIINNNKK